MDFKETGFFATNLIFTEISKYDIDQAAIQSRDAEFRGHLEVLEGQREKVEDGL